MKGIVLLMSVFLSCGEINRDKWIRIQHELDSTNKILDSLMAEKNRMEEVQPVVERPVEKTDTTVVSQVVREKKKRIIRTEEKTKEQLEYYYTNGNRLSLKIIPLDNHSRDFVLYDPWGKETYRLEQRIHSYSVTVHILDWHANGAVKTVRVNTNPGASMYWYESTYSFGLNNEPEWRVDRQLPERNLDYPGENSFYWDKSARAWKKQEVIYEQPVPQH